MRMTPEQYKRALEDLGRCWERKMLTMYEHITDGLAACQAGAQ